MTSSKKMIEESKLPIHEGYCYRNIRKCELCEEMIDVNNKQEHIEEMHTKVKCEQCSADFDKNKLEDHKKNQCPMRKKHCEYCNLDVSVKDFSVHVASCGSRTKNCMYCDRIFKLRDIEAHEVGCLDEQAAEKERRIKEEARRKEEAAKMKAAEEERTRKLEEQRMIARMKEEEERKKRDSRAKEQAEIEERLKRKQKADAERAFGEGKNNNTKGLVKGHDAKIDKGYSKDVYGGQEYRAPNNNGSYNHHQKPQPEYNNRLPEASNYRPLSNAGKLGLNTKPTGSIILCRTKSLCNA